MKNITRFATQNTIQFILIIAFSCICALLIYWLLSKLVSWINKILYDNDEDDISNNNDIEELDTRISYTRKEVNKYYKFLNKHSIPSYLGELCACISMIRDTAYEDDEKEYNRILKFSGLIGGPEDDDKTVPLLLEIYFSNTGPYKVKEVCLKNIYDNNEVLLNFGFSGQDEDESFFNNTKTIIINEKNYIVLDRFADLLKHMILKIKIINKNGRKEEVERLNDDDFACGFFTDIGFELTYDIINNQKQFQSLFDKYMDTNIIKVWNMAIDDYIKENSREE